MRARPRRLSLAAVAALALAGVYSLAAPWLAERRVGEAYDALAAGELAVAADRARDARSLNPTSVEPLFALGDIAFAQGQFDRAREQYVRATEVQPANRETWFRLGQLEYEVERYQDALVHFDQMYVLDPHGPHVNWVNGTRCKLNRNVPCPRGFEA
jgi:tetratricopeptide (TPR) repeat protein